MSWSEDRPSVDLHLTLSPAPDGANLRATISARGDPGSPAAAIVPAFDRDWLRREYLAPLEAFTERAVSSELLEGLGRELAARLLPPPVRERLEAALLRCSDPATRARLWLAVDSHELAALPWEFTYLCPGRSRLGLEGFLGLHPRLHLVRRPLRTPDAAILARTLPTGPRRILVAWANPATARYPALPYLQTEVESVVSALRQFHGAGVMVDELRYASKASLRDCLRTQPPHVLHYAGHADLRPSGGVLIVHGEEEGGSGTIYPDELADWLKGGTVRLVVLSACQTAAPTPGGGAGLALALSERGVPAVLAMQLPLRDSSAAILTRALSSALTEDAPVDEALHLARQAVRGMGPDWGVPALYLAGESGQIFEPKPPRPQPEPPFTVRFRHNPDLRGRDVLLAELHHGLNSPAQAMALVGMAGLGKTQLAADYAHRYRTRYPAGVFWLSASDSMRLQEDYAALGRFFSIPENLSTSERAALVRDRLQQLQQPALLILDNLTEQTEPVLPAVGPCRLLVTTRERRLVPEGFQGLGLPPLDNAAAVDVLLLNREAPTPAERAAAAGVAEKLGCLPLALSLARDFVRGSGTSFVEYNAWLVENRGTHRPPWQTVFTAIDLSHRSLTPDARTTLGAAACFAGRGISRALLDLTTGLESAAFGDALADLEQRSLITWEADDRLSVHEMVRSFARGQMSPSARRLVVARVCDLLTGCLRTANDAMEWTDARRELAHCRAAAELAQESDAIESRYLLQREMGRFLDEHGDGPDALGCLSDGLAIADRLFPRPNGEAALFLRLIGEVQQTRLQQPGPALKSVRAAFSCARAVFAPEDPELVEYYNSMGLVLKLQGRLWRALPYYHRALAISESANGRQRRLVALCRNDLGALCEAQRDLDQAIRYYTEALAIAREVVDPAYPWIAAILNNLGRVYSRLDDWRKATDCHRQAITIYEERHLPGHLDIGMSAYYLALALSRQNRAAEAQDYASQALPTLERHYGPEHPVCLQLGRLIREEPDSREAN